MLSSFRLDQGELSSNFRLKQTREHSTPGSHCLDNVVSALLPRKSPRPCREAPVVVKFKV
ncbi:hypothetical protein PVL29_010150 [Vitis rotundifolia]|uniref:Uncharacterized protein n=1 Tax=Vitis rotundifolia TaxID=103349 RepID=A0AA38ZSQ5_VITRO|nr:hypothetical protein PVL29_010150 [Vitis rotundifolia]